MARLSRLVDKEYLRDRIEEALTDLDAVVLAGGVRPSHEETARVITDEVYSVFSELDSEDMEDWPPMTYDPEDEDEHSV